MIGKLREAVVIISRFYANSSLSYIFEAPNCIIFFHRVTTPTIKPQLSIVFSYQYLPFVVIFSGLIRAKKFLVQT